MHLCLSSGLALSYFSGFLVILEVWLSFRNWRGGGDTPYIKAVKQVNFSKVQQK